MDINSEIIWSVAGSSVRGATHTRNNKPCQDAVKFEHLSKGIILAVADGHGSERSPYSDEGSQIAVNTAVDILKRLWEEGRDNLTTINRLANEDLPKSLVRSWMDSVRAKHLEQSRQEFSDADLFVKYGSTILSVLATSKYLLFFQLGDGDILMVEDDGQTSRPIPLESRLIANETTSLCTKEAWREVRVAFQPLHNKVPKLILVATDGYANSFVNEAEFLKLGKDYLELIQQYGLKKVSGDMEDWLFQTTEHGSGDDISMGIICRKDVAAAQILEIQRKGHSWMKTWWKSPFNIRFKGIRTRFGNRKNKR